MKKLLLTALAIFLLASPLWAATTANTTQEGIIVLTGLDADWSGSSTFAQGIKIKAVKMYPSAVNDVLMLRAVSLTGPVFTIQKSVDGGVTKEYFDLGIRIIPFLESTDCTFSTPANAYVIIEYEP